MSLTTLSQITGCCCCCAPDAFAAIAPWDHSWDAYSMLWYDDPGGDGYDIPPAVRVEYVADGGSGLDGDRPMLKDQGPYGALFSMNPVPGPLYVRRSPVFAGRPAWESDIVFPIGIFFDNIHSMMSPQIDKNDTGEWFGWAEPWWIALLIALVPSDGGNEDAFIDGDPGMVTMQGGPTVLINTWLNLATPGPTIDSGVALDRLQSCMVVAQINGASSFLDVTYRDEDGTLITDHTAGSQTAAVTMETMHTGWTNMNTTSAIGMAQGTCSPEQLEAIRLWSHPYLTFPD